jgi:hypothetical protein
MIDALQIASNFVVLSEEFEYKTVRVFDTDDVRGAWRGEPKS